jgi:deoxyribodipyrimidine photo-lyase
MESVVIHIFHRDLRTEDNLGLIEAVKKAKTSNCKLLPVFIFTPEQVGSKNPFRSENSIQFMIESLKDLSDQLEHKLTIIRSTQQAALKSFLKHYSVVAISENQDYTPFAKEREADTKAFCTKHSIEYILTEDVYLTNPGTVLNKSRKPYQKFTPFYEEAKTHPVQHPKHVPQYKDLLLKSATLHTEMPKYDKNPNIHVKGGTTEAKQLLKHTPQHYVETRDIPSIPTSNLSAHNHFGTVSIRQVYYSNSNVEFRRQLYWRDFFGHICHFFEQLYKVSPYDFQKTPTQDWSTNKDEFKKWTDGKTGFPFVDAAMIQLKETGYIHNRARMTAATYLTKHLKIYWRWGEQWFAKHLVDYDFAQNFGNWCSVASVTPFGTPPFRTLNPEIQQKKFDPDNKYVDTWLRK